MNCWLILYQERAVAATLKVRTMRWWVCHNPIRKGVPCNAKNIEKANSLQEEIGSDEFGMRVQCGKSEKKRGESEKAYQKRSNSVRRLEEFIREQMHEDAGVAATKTCETCEVRKALSPYRTAIISTPEVLILRLEYFGNGMNKPYKLGFKYGLWLDLSEFQTSLYRRKRKSMKYRLSSVLFHCGPNSGDGYYVGIHIAPTGIWAVSDTSVRDMLTTENGGEAAKRLWNITYSRVTPASLVYVRC